LEEEEKMGSRGSGIPRRALDDEVISPAKLIARLKNAGYFHKEWPGESPLCTDVGGFGDPSGATGAFNFAHFLGLYGGQAAYHILGSGQTLVVPQQAAASGLLVAGLDLTTAMGVEYIFGGIQTDKNPLGGTVGDGTRGNRLIRHRFNLGDASEAAECAVGFRLAEAAGPLDDYNDMVCINVQAGVVNVETIVGDATTVTTPFPRVSAVADGDDIELEVRLKGGKPTFIFTNHTKVESGDFQVADAESLVDAIVYVPFAHLLQGAAGCSWNWAAITCADVEDDNESFLF
jgi:hypothetical protein